MTYKDLLSNPRYRNWVKAGLGFIFLKEGLESFVDNEMRGLRDAFLQDICKNLVINEASCKSCTTADVIRCPTNQICNVKKGICSIHGRSNKSMASRQCPNQICSTIHQKIEDQHLHNNPSWKNTDASQWCTNPWQIAKCYMPQGGYENKNSVTETDCSGILNVIINCLHLHNGLDTGMGQPNNICARILNMRNEVFHSATFELTDDELTSLINEMTALLQDKKKLLNDTGAQTAVVKLTELKDGAFYMSTTDELEIKKAALKDLEEETKQLALIQEFMKEKQTDIEKKQTEVEARQRLVEEKQADTDTRQNIVEKKQADAESRQNIVEKQQADAESRQNIVEKKQADAETRQNIVENKQADVEIRQNIVENKQADTETRQNIIEKKQANAESRQNIVEKKQADDEIRQNIVENKQADFDTRQHVLERNQDDLQKEIMKLNMKLDNIRGIKDRHQQDIEYLERKKELQDQLCSIYDDHISSIPVSPVLPEITAELDDVFVELVICDDLVHEPKKLEKRLDTDKNVKGYRDVLYKQDQKCKNVYVIADAGMGKTTWCMNLLSSWVKCYKKKTDQNLDLDNGITTDEKTLSEFHIVLFASLRHETGLSNIQDMLERDLFSEHPHLVEITKEVLEKEPQRCLVVLDGLDEWSSPDNFKSCSFSQHPGLPGRGGLHDCTVLTTTRPWKLDAIRKVSIDRAVKIQGIQNPYLLAQKIIEYKNRNEVETTHIKKKKDFEKNIKEIFNEDQPSFLEVPLILMFMVCIWLDKGTLESTLAENYSELLELLITYAHRDEASGKPGRLSVVPNLQDLKDEWVQSASSLPKCLQNRTNGKYYSKLLLTLSKLAFDALFDSKKENNLVFTTDSLQNKILRKDLDKAVKIGLLSQTRAVGTLLKRKISLSFLHKSVQEYMAALHLVCDTQSGNCEAMDKYKHYCTSWSCVQEMENVLMFVCGMNPEVASKMSKYAYEVAILKDIPAGSPHLSEKYIENWYFLQWARKYINEISIAHGDMYPSIDYPFHYGYKNISLLLYHRNTYKQEINLLKTNRAHIKDLTIIIYNEFIPNQYKEIVSLLSEELQQPNYMVESFSLQDTPFLPEVTPLLSKAIPQMDKLIELKLHSVHLPDTASETVMDLSCCKHLEKFVCSNVDHIKVTLNQKMLKLIQLQNVSMFSLNVKIGKSNCAQKLTCTNSTDCSLDFTNTFTDTCNEQVQCFSKDNIVHIGTVELRFLTKCKVHFGSGVQFDKFVVAGDFNMCSVCFHDELVPLSKVYLGFVSYSQQVQLENIHFSKLNISESTASNLNSYVYKLNDKGIHILFADRKTSICEVFAAHFPQMTIKALSFNGYGDIVCSSTVQDLQHLTNLRHLICKELPKRVCEELWKVLPTLTQLEKLDLTNLQDSRSVIQSYKHLTNLHHVKCANIDNTACKVLGEILQQLPQLKTLAVDRADIIPSSQHLTHLTCENISRDYHSCQLAKQLRKPTQLETLQLYTCKVEEFGTHNNFIWRIMSWGDKRRKWGYKYAESVIQTLQYLDDLKHLTLNIDLSFPRSPVDYTNIRNILAHSLSRNPVDRIDMEDTLLNSLKKLRKLEILELQLGMQSINLSQLCNLKKITFNVFHELDNDQWKELLDNLPKQHPNHNLEVMINYTNMKEQTIKYIEKLTRFPSQQRYLEEGSHYGIKTVILQEEAKVQ